MRNNYVLLSLLAAVATPVFSHSTDAAKPAASQPEAKRWFGGRNHNGHHGGGGVGFGSSFGNRPGHGGNGRGNRGGYGPGFGGHRGGNGYYGDDSRGNNHNNHNGDYYNDDGEYRDGGRDPSNYDNYDNYDGDYNDNYDGEDGSNRHHHHNDDEGDYYYNDTSPVFTSDDPTAFTCDSAGYLVQSTTLYTIDLSSGNYAAVTTTLTDQTNAIGYNVRDNFLYGRQGPADGPYNLVRIHSDGTDEVITSLDSIPSSVGDPNTGDIDARGYYWLSSAGGAWWKIDLRHPSNDSFGTIIDSGTADNLGYNIADWVYIPSAGRYLYAIGTKGVPNTSTLLRFHLRGDEQYTWTVVRDFEVDGLPSGTWGAQYGVDTGYVYASDNASGEIWRFPVSESGGDAVKEADGPASGLNDDVGVDFDGEDVGGENLS
ncbi:hypothetical protein B0T19DRAFT_468504 [Cercophora scortea]|uniref:DUF6923 domain-containing protein n=1 Tax=Cercophora scortea TaxID=314031 RepID=A0AAE0I850_9PEZI|nr:hypothetical protein B0T19DRAFT_468504 [Cercophora scortea]